MVGGWRRAGEIGEQGGGRCSNCLDRGHVGGLGRSAGLATAHLPHVLLCGGPDLGLGGRRLRPRRIVMLRHMRPVWAFGEETARELSHLHQEPLWAAGNHAVPWAHDFQSHTYDPSAYDPETQRQLKALIQFFEDKGLAEMKQEFHPHVVPGLPRLQRQGGDPRRLRHPGGSGWRGRPVGHRPDQRPERDPRLLLPVLLVRLAGDRVWARG